MAVMIAPVQGWLDFPAVNAKRVINITQILVFQAVMISKMPLLFRNSSGFEIAGVCDSGRKQPLGSVRSPKKQVVQGVSAIHGPA
jgi:hypothetical protein